MGVLPVVRADAPAPIVLRPAVSMQTAETATQDRATQDRATQDRATQDLPEEVVEVVEDPWFRPMRDLVETLSDAYFDKPHRNVLGMTAGEVPAGRELRLDGFTREVLAAVRARAGELAQFGPDAAWNYAATLVWTAHRETRIASNPGKLGNQDQGKAHGYWQVWTWHGQDPYAAATAIDMLIAEPGASWSLPKGKPWLGYPECARWLAAHPAPSGALNPSPRE
jgi:hypothetical protein